MGFKCGILGLSNVGKSTVFNALTATAAAQASNYPFSTVEPLVGEVLVPDPRLETLAKLAKSVKIKPTRLSFVDIAGLVSGASRAGGNALSRRIEARAREEGAACVVMSAKIEAEIAVLPPEERADYLAALGLKEAGIDRLIRAGYSLLNLITYFTAGPKEAAAWTITRGTKAPQAAAVIHSDFERGFIRAETIAYDDYVSLGGEAGAQAAGKMRLEGKTYVVADGDVMHFRFAT